MCIRPFRSFLSSNPFLRTTPNSFANNHLNVLTSTHPFLIPIAFEAIRSQSKAKNLSVSNRSFEKTLPFTLNKDEKCNLILNQCRINQVAIEKLKAWVKQKNVIELSLPGCTLPSNMIGSLLLDCCEGDVHVLNIMHIPIDDEHLKVLVNNLPQSQLQSLSLTLSLDQKSKEIETLCEEMGIQLYLSRLNRKPKSSESVVPQKKSLLFKSKNVDQDIYGGFFSYKIIQSVQDLEEIIPSLMEGMFITLEIHNNNQPNNTLIITIARGKGFIIPLNQLLKGRDSYDVKTQLRKILENPKIPKNYAAYRATVFALNEIGIFPKGLSFDLYFCVRTLGPKTSKTIEKSIRKNLKEQGSDIYKKHLQAIPRKIQRDILRTQIQFEKFLLYQLKLEKLGQIKIFTTALMVLEEMLLNMRKQKLLVNPSILRAFRKDSENELSLAEENIRLYSSLIHREPLPLFAKYFLSYFDKTQAYLEKIGIKLPYKSSSVESLIPSICTEQLGYSLIQRYREVVAHCKKYEEFESRLSQDKIAIINRTPTPFKGVVSLPQLEKFSNEFFTHFLQNTNKHVLIAIRFHDIFLRVFAHLSKDKALRRICNYKGIGDKLEKRINRKVYKSKKYLSNTELIHNYVCGKIEKSTLLENLGKDSEAYLEQYYTSFPSVKLFLEKTKTEHSTAPFPIYRALRLNANLFFSLFITSLHNELSKQNLKGRIIAIDSYFILIKSPANEVEIFRQLSHKLSKTVIKWSVELPLSFEVLTPEKQSHTDFVKTRLQSVRPLNQSIFSTQITRSVGSKISPHMEQEIDTILSNYFSSAKLKPLQTEVIHHILNHHSTVALLPTGYGKSLCFQIPILVQEGIGIIISPLVSLIENQVQALNQRKISAKWIKSVADCSLSTSTNQVKLLYITPELFSSPHIINALSQLKINLFVLDEAHCIYDWGHTFRESYRKLGVIKGRFPKVPILALSATMTKESIQDIKQSLKIDNSHFVSGPLFRKNLYISLIKKTNINSQLIDFLKQRPNQPGIIYCQQQKEVDDLYIFLEREGFSCKKYHAGMDPIAKEQSLKAFITDQVNLMIATVAFGMGIDKPNVRFVCHTKMPGSLEQYYQEIGRAGRDNRASECVLFYSDHDFMEALLLKKELVTPEIGDVLHLKANQIFNFCHTVSRCRQNQLESYFTGVETDETCDSCDVCLKLINLVDGTEIVKHIIKAVIITNGSAGVSNLSKLLCGVENSYSFKSDQINTTLFGVLSKFDVQDVRSLIRYLIQEKYFTIIEPESDLADSLLTLNEKSKNVLFGREKVMIQELLHAKADCDVES